MNTKKIHRRKQPASRGFTIIETLVAITILMIAIAGPLSVAGKGLTAAVYSRDQMIATFLAQETMETVKNARDNYIRSGSWLESAPGKYFDACTATSLCDQGALDSMGYTTCLAQGCQLYLGPSGYSNAAVGTPSPFHRFFYLDPLGGYSSKNQGVAEYTVHVIVNWNEGTVPYRVDLSSELVQVSRN